MLHTHANSIIFLISCLKDDDLSKIPEVTNLKKTKAYINTGKAVSKKVINYIKEKTNNTLHFNISSRNLSLSNNTNPKLSRESVMGSQKQIKKLL